MSDDEASSNILQDANHQVIAQDEITPALKDQEELDEEQPNQEEMNRSVVKSIL